MSEERIDPAPKQKLPNNKKLTIVGVVVVVIVVAGMGFWTWHNSPSFCGAFCHTPMNNYVETYDQQAGAPGTDKWGNEVSNGSAPERVFQSFFSPGFLKAQDNSPATQEIRRLAKATGDSTVYPAAVEKSYTVKGETRTMTGEEYTQYAKAMGSTRKTLVEAAVKLPAYKSMSDSEKSDYIQNVYKYAKETARQQVDPKYEPSAKWIENAKTSKRDIGVSTAEYLALYQQYGSEKMSGKAYEKVKQAHDAGLSPKAYFSMKDRADADGNGRVSKAEASAALAGQENRADLWDIICTTNAKNPYK